MPEQPTKPPLEDDIRTLDEYVLAVEQAAAKSAGTGLTVFFFAAGLAGLIAHAFWEILLGMTIMLSAIGGAIVVQRRKAADIPLHFPEAALARLAASHDEQAIAALFRLHEFSLLKMQEPIAKALIAYLQKTTTPEVKIEEILLQDRLLALTTECMSSMYGGSQSHAGLMVTVIETIARLDVTAALPNLIRIASVTTTVAGGQSVREAASEAVVLLSAHADFGTKADIPAKIKEFYKDNYDVNFSPDTDSWLMYSLTQLLPTLTKADTELLDKKHRELLYALCKSNQYKRNYSELKQAIVLALGNMEDTDALPTIFHLAHSDAPTDHEQDTRTMAKKQLAILTKIKEKQKVGSMLLRASDAPATAQDELLRPAHATQETQPETLLRPHLGE